MHSLLEFNFKAIALMCNDACTLKEIIYTSDFELQRRLVMRSQFYYLDTVLRYAARSSSDWQQAVNEARTMEPTFSSLHLLAQELLKSWRRTTDDGWFLSWDEKLHEIFIVPLPNEIAVFCPIPEIPKLLLNGDNGIAERLQKNFTEAGCKIPLLYSSGTLRDCLVASLLPYALAYLSVFYMTNDRG